MANQPQQLPNIDLPGAEYFALAPNRTIDLSGRRRFVATSTPLQNVPAGGGAFGQFISQIETTFNDTSGIYIHAFWAAIAANAAGIQLTNATTGLSRGTSPGTLDYVIGVPIITTLTFNIGGAILTDRDRLVAARDILGGSGSTPLSLITQIFINNPTAGVIGFNITQRIIYTRLEGLTE